MNFATAEPPGVYLISGSSPRFPIFETGPSSFSVVPGGLDVRQPQFFAIEKGGQNTIASLGHAYAVAGDKSAALKTLDKLKSLAKEGKMSPYQRAVVYAGLGEKDQAFDSLEKANQERSTLLVYLKMDLRLDNLRSDPRFGTLLRRMSFPT